MKPILEVQNISKKFLIQHQQLPYLSFRDKLSGLFSPKEATEEFWALRDISFDVQPGESIGIIGRNGAGKSTLLKILSRITPPTTGRITVRGRIASLLEVGTGFHQELTGRENIFMNGSILGMKHAEIKAKFDEIVDFSGTEKFLDTPLKHYSSGMQLRLAFAVAAHLEPEILIIDEVLAVGDAEFQKKCLGKMEDVTRSGKTILFVSHNMTAVSGLCQKGLLLVNGAVSYAGQIDQVLSKYLSVVDQLASSSLLSRKDREGNGAIRFSDVQMINERGEEVKGISSGHTVAFRFWYLCNENYKGSSLRMDVGMNDNLNNRVAWFSTELTPGFNGNFSGEKGYIDLKIADFPFNEGKYSFTVYSQVNGIVADWIKDACVFYVEGGDFFKVGKTVLERQGPFLVKHQFEIGE
ncbi:MAG TPA: ABC transporter ATP-binding protein [Niabella sp.]|nr:ABC transporter ATP-binding protein [Niabella sp.]